MLPQSFGRISTAGSTVRGLVSHAFFSTRDGSDMVVMIDGEKTFNDVVVRAGCGVRHPKKTTPVPLVVGRGTRFQAWCGPLR